MKVWSVCLCLIGFVCLSGLFLRLSPVSFGGSDMPDMPGAKTDYTNREAPKEIVSEEIVKFYCQFFTKDDDGNSIAAYYTLEKQGDTVLGHADDTRMEGTDFTTDEEALVSLQKIIKDSGIVFYNGTNVHVGGLPELGGSLVVDYASGERLYIIDNQVLLFEAAVPGFLDLFWELTQE